MKRFVCLCVVMSLLTTGVAVSAEEAKVGHFTGKWVAKETGPMAGGLAYFFNVESGPPPSPNKYWRIPDEIADVDESGRFSAELVAGKYNFGLIKRASKKGIGPPENGDQIFFSTAQNGKPKVYTVKTNQKTDLGTITQTDSFKFEKTSGITAIEGRVIDSAGKPVPDALVFASLTPGVVGRPLFVSERTTADGKYLLRVNQGGRYYLKVRMHYGGGQPTACEIVGGYGVKDKLLAVRVKTAAIQKGIDLKTSQFTGRGPKL